jgi:hypothetical protein
MKMQTDYRGKGPLAGWKANFEETTDTFDIDSFLKTDAPTNAQECADIKRAITEGGTFGDYRCVESDRADGINFFVQGPNSILFAKKEDRSVLIQAIERFEMAETESVAHGWSDRS